MIVRTLFAVSVIATAGLMSHAAPPERIGTSTADAPNLRGAFVIHNSTTAVIRYWVKWGKNGKWDLSTLEPGYKYTHSYPLNGDKAPAPYVRFDNKGGDGKVTYTEMPVNFGRVGYAGYGPKGQVNEACHYDFKYRKDRRNLDLIER